LDIFLGVAVFLSPLSIPFLVGSDTLLAHIPMMLLLSCCRALHNADEPCQVTAKLDARAPPPGQRAEVIEALFTFMHLDQVLHALNEKERIRLEKYCSLILVNPSHLTRF